MPAPHRPRRDGTSRPSRRLRALDPDFVSIDERGLEEMLDFVRRYGAELRFFDVGSDGEVETTGDWSGLVGAVAGNDRDAVARLVEFTRHPERFPEAEHPELYRPHLTLLLVFLRLQLLVQGRFRELTGRHLDFVYRRLLGLGRKGPLPDQVHLLVEPSPGTAPVSVPAGTRFDAGVDALGHRRTYACDRDVVIYDGRLARIRSLRTDGSNFWPTADATEAVVETGLEASAAEEAQRLPRWKTFGLPETRGSEPARIGWALASPIWAAAEGLRTFHLTLEFAGESLRPGLEALRDLADDGSLVVELTTATGLVKADGVTARLLSYSQPDLDEPDEPDGIRLSIHFTADMPAVEAPPLDLERAPSSRRPTLRCTLPSGAETSKLREMRLMAVRAEVEVEGLAGLRLRNDTGPVDPSKAFQPFGAAPHGGSRLLIGHPELVRKEVDHVSLAVKWAGFPPALADHYRNYRPADATGSDARLPGSGSTIAWHDRGTELDAQDASTLFPETVNPGAADPKLDMAADLPGRILDTSLGTDVGRWDRRLVWRLGDPDFFHGSYPGIAAKKALDMAVDMVNGKADLKSLDYHVEPPYTPTVESLRLGYRASVEIPLDVARPSDADDGLFHIHPFGACNAESERAEVADPDRSASLGLPLLPAYAHRGELYLGLAGLRPPQTVSLLFQLVEGSADPELPADPVRWSLLDGDRWRDLDDRLLLDSTRGLVQTGIVELALPESRGGSRLGDPDLVWLRAAVAHRPDAVCDTIAVHPRALSATFVDRGNDPEHYRRPLPATSIRRLVKPIPGIAGVEQPYSSSGGRPSEAPEHFDTRVSERLRHKQRALQPWDYERLVLEAFPEIYKVKCLPVGVLELAEAGLSGVEQVEPGRLQVVVIPDVRGRRPFDPFAPKASTELLSRIESFLKAHAPDTARIEVRNPHYVSVQTRFGVRFRRAGHEAFDRQRLQQELIRHLSPWAYGQGADLEIGGRIYSNSLIDFLDRRPYVDHIVKLRLFSSEDGGLTFRPANRDLPAGEGYHVTTPRLDGVLVPHPEHFIDLVGEDTLEGIGYLRIGLDFQVSDEAKP